MQKCIYFVIFFPGNYLELCFISQNRVLFYVLAFIVFEYTLAACISVFLYSEKLFAMRAKGKDHSDKQNQNEVKDKG